MTLHIAIAAPIATEHVAHLLSGTTDDLPKGNSDAPFTSVLIAELLRQGHKVSAFTTDTGMYPDKQIVKAQGTNFDLYICAQRRHAWRPNSWRPGRALDAFGYERRLLAKAISAAQPDIIHAHWSYEFALAAIKTGLPHLISCHDAPAVVLRFSPYPYRAIRYLMARQVFRRGSHFSTVSEYMVEQLQHYVRSKIAVVPNPLADYVLSSGHIRQTPDSWQIGLICNGWDARKNPKPALQAFAMLHANQPLAKLHVYGHGFGSGQEAEIWCREQNISSGIVFHGATPHRQLISQLDKLDLLLHPAREESFGVVLAEAMALGLPIVAGKFSGAVPWVVGADNNDTVSCAVLTDINDAHAILTAIEAAMDQDYAIRSAAGFHRARQLFGSIQVADAYLALCRQILLQSATSVS
ncbi:glycosyltransferase family 4 protein [Methylomonas paludis]|uniref:Glycosyltransferase family 4 protein n=1 Tax=Methylomonas paludis TaxID=1173101 RepID=A0A975MMP1_9GAMM|nr:glycosyltransferase family 4 protein [Methylomonas paludis]QWF70708.1 glycosyltransferase family 4 protein [Methylomonas paludis]